MPNSRQRRNRALRAALALDPGLSVAQFKRAQRDKAVSDLRRQKADVQRRDLQAHFRSRYVSGEFGLERRSNSRRTHHMILNTLHFRKLQQLAEDYDYDFRVGLYRGKVSSVTRTIGSPGNARNITSYTYMLSPDRVDESDPRNYSVSWKGYKRPSFVCDRRFAAGALQ